MRKTTRELFMAHKEEIKKLNYSKALAHYLCEQYECLEDLGIPGTEEIFKELMTARSDLEMERIKRSIYNREYPKYWD